MVIYSFHSGNSDITVILGSKALQPTQTVGHKVNVLLRWLEYFCNPLSLPDLSSYWKVAWDYALYWNGSGVENLGISLFWEKEPLNMCCPHVEANSPLVTHVNNGLFHFGVKCWKNQYCPRRNCKQCVVILQSPLLQQALCEIGMEKIANSIDYTRVPSHFPHKCVLLTTHFTRQY